MQGQSRANPVPSRGLGSWRTSTSEGALEDLQKRVNLLEDIFKAGLSFGVPVSIDSLGAAYGQRIGQMKGSWVEVAVGLNQLGTNLTFTHNLGLGNLTSATKCNVRWLPWGLQHDGTNAGAGDTISVVYSGGTVTGNSIQLMVHAAGARLVDNTHKLTVTLFFVPADG